MRFASCLLVVAIGVTACGGAAVPHDKLSSAKAAMRAAEVAGAPNDPQGALRVKKAGEAIAHAEKLIKEDENERASYVLERAQVDAELALALAQDLTMRGEAEEAQREVAKLKAEVAQ